MNQEQLNELLLQSLEHESGGIKVYETALKCVQNEALRQQWEEYLKQTRNHEKVLRKACEAIGVNPEQQTPGRGVVRHVGTALVEAMQQALAAGNPTAAELVACECVVLAETKDHADWQLIGKCAEQLEGAEGQALQAAYEEVEDQEDEHLYHTKGWCRELWIQSLGLNAVLPPLEEVRQVKTAIGAAKAEQAGEMLR